MASTGGAVGIDGGGGVVGDGGAGYAACVGEGVVGVVDHELFAEGIDEAFGASGDGYAQRFDRFDADGVADGVAPQAVA